MSTKRCLTIQDYSCLGRCSMTVALPILSASGTEAVGIPTAVLSNHTAYASWTYHDLTDEMLLTVEKWRPYHPHFDCLYTGYLGDGQAAIVKKIIEKACSSDTLIVVDPAFGDNGKIYPGFTQDHVFEIKDLIAQADVILPNVTEAYALLGKEFTGDAISTEEILPVVKALAALGPKQVVLTGIIRKEDGAVGEAIYDDGKESLTYYYTPCYPGRYHGAGDCFASALVGALLQGVPFAKAVQIAHDFVHRSIASDLRDNIDGILYGLEFEENIPSYIKDIEEAKK